MPMLRSPPPAETDLLCESCGYILNGLDATPATNCPECGQPLAPSLEPDARVPAPIEVGRGGFWRTTAMVLIRKRKFFRTTLSRPTSPGAKPQRVAAFGRRHRIMAGTLFGLAAGIHLAYMADAWLLTRAPTWSPGDFAIWGAATLVLIGVSIVLVSQLTRLAIWMTTKESRWWGMRLPTPVVRRAMDFHAANYLPVGILAVALTGGFRLLIELRVLTLGDAVPYLVALSAAVVASAIWLFESFVIAMRRIRYANY